jgi:hypothetical protein
MDGRPHAGERGQPARLGRRCAVGRRLPSAAAAGRRVDDAEALLRRIAVRCERVLPPGDPLTRAVQQSLARFEEA